MITVNVLINGQPVITRSAKRIGTVGKDLSYYAVDDGRTIQHKRSDDAAVLAAKMLEGVVNFDKILKLPWWAKFLGWLLIL